MTKNPLMIPFQMTYPTKALLIGSLLLSSVAVAQGNYLHYMYNDNVRLTISNVPCPIDELKNSYPLAASASRKDGAHLIGCYKKFDENLIEIQWYKGDKTVVPANAFLQNPEDLKLKVIPTL